MCKLYGRNRWAWNAERVSVLGKICTHTNTHSKHTHTHFEYTVSVHTLVGGLAPVHTCGLAEMQNRRAKISGLCHYSRSRIRYIHDGQNSTCTCSGRVLGLFGLIFWRAGGVLKERKKKHPSVITWLVRALNSHWVGGLHRSQTPGLHLAACFTFGQD